MSAPLFVYLCILVGTSLLVGALSYHLGERRGYRQGRDAEWVESYIAAGRRDRSRRDARGRYTLREISS